MDLTTTPNFCPHCGRPHSGGLGGGWQMMTTMQSSAPTPWNLPAPAGGYMEAWRRSPARTPGFISDVAVPAGQAGLIALAVGTASILLPAFHPGISWFTPLVTFTLTFGFSVIRLVASNRSHLWSEEHITQGEKQEAPPQQLENPTVQLNVTHTNSKGKVETIFNFELPDGFTERKFYDFARGVTLGGKGLAQNDWVTGFTKLCSKPKYQELLATLEKAGIVTWVDPKNHSVGRKLTGQGRRSLLQFVYSYHQGQAGTGRQATPPDFPAPPAQERGDEV